LLKRSIENDGMEESEVSMPIKPNGSLCKVREQIVEDDASGLILQFECSNGRTRLVIAGDSLPFGNREIIFDDEGCEAAAGTLLGSFRRPSWLTKVK
jgi:hypothetical protein